MTQRYVFYSDCGGFWGQMHVYEVQEGEDPFEALKEVAPSRLREGIAWEPYDNWVLQGSKKDTFWVQTRFKQLKNLGQGAAVKPVIGPRKPIPALPVEVHHTHPFDADEAMRAMRSLCAGRGGD